MNTTYTITAALILGAASTAACAKAPSTATSTTTAASYTSPASTPRAEPRAPAQPTPEPLPPAAIAGVPLPGGASLLERESLTEIEAFPEEEPSPQGRGREVEESIGAHATDRTYRTDRSYRDIVGFFDGALAQGGFTVEQRGTTANTTSWRIRRPDGSPGRVAVRNTTPTTFEVVTTDSAAVESK